MTGTPIAGVPAAVLWVAALVLKATLVLAAAGALTALLRRASAALRHLVWSGALGALLILPLLSLSLPWRLPLPVAAGVPAPIAAPRAERPGTRAPTASSRAMPAMASAGPSIVSAGHEAAAPAPRHRSPSPLSIALLIWAVGALAILGQLVLDAWRLRRIVRRAEPLTGEEWRSPLVEAGGRLALGRLPQLVMASGPPMPFACGLVRPVIVLPRRAAEWDERRRRAVLCHELAHVRRADLRVNALARVAAGIFWFHPLAWVALRRLRAESERACDDLVLASGTRPSEYADHLLQIVSAIRRTPVPAVALPLARRQEFEGRVLAILERGVERRPTSRGHTLILAGAAFALIIPLAAVAPVRRAIPAEPGPAQLQDAGRGAIGAPSGPAPSRPRPVPRPALPAQPGTAAPPAQVPPPVRGEERRDTVSTLVVTSLIRALHDPDRAVRENAVNALGHLGAPAAVPAIGATLRSDADGAVREMAAWALGEIGDTAAVTSLAAATGDADARVRLTSVWALGELGAADAVPALVTALDDRSSEVRSRAAWALGTIGPSLAPPRLVTALSDTVPEVRIEAAWALGQIADPQAAAGLGRALDDRVSDVRKAVIWALGHIGGDAASVALVRALQDPDAALRAAAARALAGSEPDPWPQPMPMVR